MESSILLGAYLRDRKIYMGDVDNNGPNVTSTDEFVHVSCQLLVMSS